MPFVSQRDRRSKEQDQYQEVRANPAGFGETFGTAIGYTIDEELSISSSLNREGWEKRRVQVEQMISDGLIDKEKYTVPAPRGARAPRYLWDAIARDFEEVKSEKELNDERNQLLADRREYAQDVFARGGMAGQLLGSMTAYMLDPISIATVPVATATTTAKGIAGVGHAMLKAAAVEGMAELGIQGFVYSHKDEIDSPYGWQDAVTNIGLAASGAAILSGAGKGIGDYIATVRARGEELPPSNDLNLALENLSRIEDTIRANPKGGTIESDQEWLSLLETKRAEQVYKAKQNYETPEVKTDVKGTVSAKERSVLERQGLADDYDEVMAKFKDIGGEQPRRAFEIDQDFKGISIKEKVRVKETGDVVEIDADADTLWRRASKRRKALTILEDCLNA